jgi:flagellar hook capping protein FlgD
MGSRHLAGFSRPRLLLGAIGASLSLAACGPAHQGTALRPVDTVDRPAPDTMLGAEADSFPLHPPSDTIRAFVPERQDCDGNGVPDAVDIREGTEEDLNHNGVIDPCDPDTSLPSNPNNQSWRALRTAADTSFFWAGFQNRPVADGGRIVAIRYTVPLEGASVRLDVFDSRGFLVATPVSTRQDAGAYESAWNRTGADGRVLPAGMYRLRLTVEAHMYLRRVRWAV